MTRKPSFWTAVLLIPLLGAGAGAAPAKPGDVDRAALLLSRATYGARPSDLDRVLAQGVDAWLEEQLHPERIDDASVEKELERFPDLKLGTRELLERYPRPTRDEREALQKTREAREKDDSSDASMATTPGEPGMHSGPARVLVQLSQAKLLRAALSERQLQEVLVDFWFNHFNVYARKSIPTLLALPSFESDAIRPHVLGKFHDLLLATAQHPAMLQYLDNWTSTKEGYDPREALRSQIEGRRGKFGRGQFGRRGPGNGRRPLPEDAPPSQLERRKFGINENYARELLELHTLGVDGGYTQKDIIEVARCLTGWTVVSPERVRDRVRRGEGGPEALQDGRFHFNAPAHDEKPKTVLGRAIEAGGVDDGLEVIRVLSVHPSTARFISTKLAKRFASDTPSPELVKEMSDTFLRTGGDIREVLVTMFRSPRFVAEALKSPKVKTPLELVVSTVRAANSQIIGPALARTLQTLGMPLYMCQPPTGYDEESETWLSAGSMLNRIRFTAELLSGDMRGVRLGSVPADVAPWAQKILSRSSPPLSTEDTATLKEALAAFPKVKESESLQAMALVLASPAFQRQ